MPGARDGQMRVRRGTDTPPWGLDLWDDDAQVWRPVGGISPTQTDVVPEIDYLDAAGMSGSIALIDLTPGIYLISGGAYVRNNSDIAGAYAAIWIEDDDGPIVHSAARMVLAATSYAATYSIAAEGQLTIPSCLSVVIESQSLYLNIYAEAASCDVLRVGTTPGSGTFLRVIQLQ